MKKLVLGLIFGFAANTASAGLIAQYSIQDYNNGAGPHGLWTNGHSYGGDNTFEISSGLFSIFDHAGVYTATFDAIAFNSKDHKAVINLDLTDFEELTANVTYKKEGGKDPIHIVEDPLALASPTNEDIDYFKVLSGTVDIFNVGPNPEVLVNSFSMMNCCAPVFQFGNGANAKNPNEFGASAWINTSKTGAGHWDLNVSLVAVPEPSTIALFGLGLLGMGFARRRKKT